MAAAPGDRDDAAYILAASVDIARSEIEQSGVCPPMVLSTATKDVPEKGAGLRAQSPVSS
jgi:hypothetical protein